MSLYGDYIRERLGKAIIENDDGFATYYFVNEKTCYIEDIYVRPEARRTHAASKMADEITEIAKKNGCTDLVGSVAPQAFGATESMKVLIAYGFKIDVSTNDLIYLKKNIEE